ncbi:MAG: hypothetical protein EXS37_03180 [Opitutus sp.]|nr:hypothetical protein [Opitutus sp.]
MEFARALRRLIWISLGGFLFTTALLIINTKYAGYDDEGYMLLALRHYLSGLRLYDDVFSQYGPWPFVFHQLATFGGTIPLTHELGRILTALQWTGGAVLCGLMVGRFSGRMSAGIVTTAAVFCLTWQTSVEPMHPGGHLMVLIAVAAWVAAELETARARRPGLAAALGALIALVMLTKINVGIFLAAAVAGAFGRFSQAGPARVRRPFALVIGALVIALPWLLVGARCSEPWIFSLALLTSVANAALFWITPTDRDTPPTGRDLFAFLAGGMLAGTAVCLTVLARGTTVASLCQAVLIRPLTLPSKFTIPTTWPPSVWVVTAACGLLVIRAGWEIRREGTPRPLTRRLILTIRGITLAGAALTFHLWASLDGIVTFTEYGLPLLPAFVIPLNAVSAATNRLRWIVASIAALQILHLYPVTGSQRGWSIFLFVPVLVLGWDEACEVFATGPRGRTIGGRACRIGFAGLSLIAVIQLAGIGWQRHQSSRPLDLPGAESLRLPEPQRLALRVLTLNASLHADLLFSVPGMGSFNLWSGVPAPTAQHATQWFWLLPATEQRRISDRLAPHPAPP